MKHLNLIALMLILMTVFVSCEKQEENAVNTENLTTCKEGFSCTYSFFNNAMLENDGKIKNGSYRVFRAESKNNAIASLLTVEVRTTASTFSMGKNEITSGQVKPDVICPTCDYIVLKPVDGTITGQRISDSKWLLDISVLMANPITGKIEDTVKTKQVFNLATL